MQANTARPAPDKSSLRILHLEDSDADHALVCRTLDQSGLNYRIFCTDDIRLFADQVARQCYDIILADYRLSGFTALDAWQVTLEQAQTIPFLLVSGAIGEELAVHAVKMGISDFVNKADLSRLPLVIDRAIHAHRIQAEKESAETALATSQIKMVELANHLQLSIERERAKIAREIHDDIGGSLVAAKLDIAWVCRHSCDPATSSHLEAADAMLSHAMGASQRIMMALRPSILDEGLVPAIQWLADQFSKRTGIDTSVLAHEDFRLSDKDIELVAYRVVQEALTNASKHAQCRSLQVEISDAREVLTVEIRDDGVGLGPKDLEKSQSFGLRGLKERAHTVAGWLDISSATPAGTCITLSVPIAPLQHTAWDSTS